MPNYLSEQDTYTPGVYQLEITDPVLGGPDGISNKPLKDLANRTVYLKARVDEVLSALKKNSIFPDESDFDYLGQGIDFNAQFSGVTQSWKPVYRDTDGFYKLALTDGSIKQKGVGLSYLGADYNAVIFSGLVNTNLTGFGPGDDVYLSETTAGLITNVRTPLNLGVMVNSTGLMLLNTGAGSSDIMFDRLMEDLRAYPDALASTTESGLLRAIDQTKINNLGSAAYYNVGVNPDNLVTRAMLDFTAEVSPEQTFIDTAARDSYFTTNSEELVDGLYCRAADVLYKYDETGTQWLEVVEGPMGIQGPKGDDGESGFLAAFQGAWDAAYNAGAGYAQFDAVEHSGTYWISTEAANTTEPGVGANWDIWLFEGTLQHRDFHYYQNWDSEIVYTEDNNISEVVNSINQVRVKEDYILLKDTIMGSVITRSLDSGVNYTLLGTEVIKYAGTNIAGTTWWAERGTESDAALLKVNYLVGSSLTAIDTWDLITNSFDNFDLVIGNTDAFNITQLAPDANTSINTTTNSISILDSNSPVTVPTATNDMDGAVTSSSQASGSEAWRVFDTSLGTQWYTPTGNIADEWVGFEFDNPTWLYKVIISPKDSNTSPQDCRLQYFDEGSSLWQTTAEFTLDVSYSINQTFKVAYPAKARKWRLYVVNNHGSTDTIGITRLQFYGF